MRRFIETSVIFLTALLFIGTWLFEPYSVVSGSMHPTLLGPHRDFVCPACGTKNVLAADAPVELDRGVPCRVCRTPAAMEDQLPITAGDSVLVDRTVYRRRAPHRGEVIVFRLPGEETKIAVKRVIGLPGERIELHDGKFSADGKPVALPTTADYGLPAWHDGPRQWQLGPDEFFVVGDNPSVSDDSRTWRAGPGVAAQLIVGKPLIVHAPRRIVPWFGIPFHVPDVTAIRYIR